jgi:hypothetical protein
MPAPMMLMRRHICPADGFSPAFYRFIALAVEYVYTPFRLLYTACPEDIFRVTFPLASHILVLIFLSLITLIVISSFLRHYWFTPFVRWRRRYDAIFHSLLP